MVVRRFLLGGLLLLILITGCRYNPYPYSYPYGPCRAYYDYGYNRLWVDTYNVTQIPINSINIRTYSGELICLLLVGQPVLLPGETGRFEVWLPTKTYMDLDYGYTIMGYQRL